MEVIEVDRPNREERRRSGKSDPLDAVEAARSALSGRASGSPKSPRRGRRSHPGARRGQALGPPGSGQGADPDAPPRIHRPRAAPLPPQRPVSRRSGGRRSQAPADAILDPVTAATKASLSSLAHRISALDDELTGSTSGSRHSSRPPCPSSSASSGSAPTQRPLW